MYLYQPLVTTNPTKRPTYPSMVRQCMCRAALAGMCCPHHHTGCSPGSFCRLGHLRGKHSAARRSVLQHIRGALPKLGCEVHTVRCNDSARTPSDDGTALQVLQCDTLHTNWSWPKLWVDHFAFGSEAITYSRPAPHMQPQHCAVPVPVLLHVRVFRALSRLASPAAAAVKPALKSSATSLRW
jgi:hypothetical protein